MENGKMDNRKAAQEALTAEPKALLAAAVGRRLARAAQAGVTLIEVLIVVTIMALIAGGATLLVFPAFDKAKVKLAVDGARAIKQAADLHVHLSTSGDGCPTIQDLVAAKSIGADKTADPWGQQYKISCGDGDVRVLSAGADKKEGTGDDLRDNLSNAEVDKIAEK
jgi:general secretion pathway protein G